MCTLEALKGQHMSIVMYTMTIIQQTANAKMARDLPGGDEQVKERCSNLNIIQSHICDRRLKCM